MVWGFALAFEGYGKWGLDAIRDSALWYYGVFALISGVLPLWVQMGLIGVVLLALAMRWRSQLALPFVGAFLLAGLAAV